MSSRAFFLELRIRACMKAMLLAEKARNYLAMEMTRLIKLRSLETVARMEKERGLL